MRESSFNVCMSILKLTHYRRGLRRTLRNFPKPRRSGLEVAAASGRRPGLRPSDAS
jgi:hypothetical protein